MPIPPAFSTVPATLCPFRFQFFDCSVELWCDVPAYIEPFRQLYRSFVVDGFSSTASPLCVRVQTQRSYLWPEPVMYIGDTALPLHNPTFLDGLVYSHLINSILACVSSHLLIHAGVVAWQDQGILLLGDSMHGKTTLVLALLQRGFSVLSDEFAALRRSDGAIDPFPRYLSVRPRTFDILDLPIPAGSVEWLDKVAFDPEHVRAGARGLTVPLRYVFVLEGPKAEEVGMVEPNDELVVVDHLEAPLQRSIAALPGVHDLRIGRRYGYPSLEMRVGEKTPTLMAIEERCQAHGAILLDYIKQAQGHPHFDSYSQFEE